MQLSSILSVDRIKCAVPCQSKKKIFETIRRVAEDVDNEIFQASILESLVHREKMGSTGIGGGIAIPHGRIVGLTKGTAVVLITDCAIDFDAIDQQPVDIFFALLVPHEEIEGHLQTLSSVATKLNNIDVVQQIRAAQTPEEVIFALTLDSK